MTTAMPDIRIDAIRRVLEAEVWSIIDRTHIRRNIGGTEAAVGVASLGYALARISEIFCILEQHRIVQTDIDLIHSLSRSNLLCAFSVEFTTQIDALLLPHRSAVR